MTQRMETPPLTPETDGLANLKALLSGNVLALLQLEPALEAAFRAHYRIHAARVLRLSIYGFLLLYLMVVVPVITRLPAHPDKESWLWSAVFPIGVVLLVLWLSTRLDRSARFIEPTLTGCLYACLLGTIYCTLLLPDSIYGEVAGCETTLITIIAFSVLRLSIRLALAATLLAFASALVIGLFQGIPLPWLAILLFFWAPLLVCAVSGVMLEYAARREFVLTAHHKEEKTAVLRDVAAAANEFDDINAVLESALKLLCKNRGWLAGRASIWDTETAALRSTVLHVTPPASREGDRDERVQMGLGHLLATQVRAADEVSWDIVTLNEAVAAGTPATTATRITAPVKIDSKVVAVLEFFSSGIEQADERLQLLLEQVGQQLGHVFNRQQRQQELLAQATHDALTGLHNRGYLLERVIAAMARARRRGTPHFCLLFLDVDRFKWINDSLGHGAGDQVLIDIGQRLRVSSRPSDVVARLGGDEFVVLMEDIDAVGGAISAAQRIQEALRQPFTLAGHPVNVAGSMGIAMGDPRYEKPEEILRDADMALYTAKQRGRGGYVVYSPSMGQQHVDRLQIAHELKQAIENGELVLFYQPIVSLSDGHVTGFEALVRWRHPQRGLIPPNVFIPVAEDSGSIIPLTHWVLAEACRQIQVWQQDFPERPDITVSVNLPALFLVREGLPNEILAVIRQHGISPERLRLEITETHAMENIDVSITNIRLLRERGIHVYIDDFGTGYSSLNYLTRLGAHTLKIDQSFVSNLDHVDQDRVILRAITLLGRHLGMRMVAEGIETPAQLDCLRELGCDYGQGYLFAKPLDAEMAGAVINSRPLIKTGKRNEGRGLALLQLATLFKAAVRRGSSAEWGDRRKRQEKEA